MPKRFLKPGLTTSDRWNALGWMTQSFYVRLITLVDDYGRYDGRTAILRAHAFPLSPKITDDQIQGMCKELAKNELAVFYKSGSKSVLQLTSWEEKPRSEPKFPAFDNTCEQMFADVSKCLSPSSSSSPSNTPTPTAPSGELALEFPENLESEDFKEDFRNWMEFRKKIKGCKDWKSLFQAQLKWLSKFPTETARSILDQSIRNGWQGLFEVHNQQAGKAQKAPSIPQPGSQNL